MQENITLEQLKSLICYWVELKHLNNDLIELEDDADEIGEIYEWENWLKGKSTGLGTSVMDLQKILSDAKAKSYDIFNLASEGLPEMLKECRRLWPDIYKEYLDQISDEVVEKLSKMLIEDVEASEVYEYHTKEQLDKFASTVYECCKCIFNP